MDLPDHEADPEPLSRERDTAMLELCCAYWDAYPIPIKGV